MGATSSGGEPAPAAAACGALGCRETENLVRVTDGGEQRVLCPECAQRWA